MKKAIIFFLCLVAFIVPAVNAQDGNVLRVGTNAPVALDPHTNTNDPEVLFDRTIYDYLIDLTPSNELVPALATEWTVSDDGLTYDLTLREGVTFHDGEPFTAADVLFSFERMQEVSSPALSLLGEFEISSSDDLSVTFTLPSPNADFLFGVASRWSLILPDGTTEPNVLGEGDDLYANFVGTGPFILTDYQVGERATFEANPNYWADVALDGVIYEYIDESQAQVDALRSGDVDFIFKVPFDLTPALQAEDSIEVITQATNLHPVIRLRADEGFLGSDPLVREALKLATDRELLTIDLFDGLAPVGNNDPIGPLYGDFYAPIEQAYDPARACELLAEAGFPDGLGADAPLDFYVVDSFNYEQMAVLLRDQWSEGCINVEILLRPENIYYGDNEWLDVELGVTGWGSRPVAQQYLVEAYVTSALPENGGFNESRFSSEALDALVEEAAVTADIDARAEIYAQIAQIFAEEGPVIVPFFTPMIGAVNNSVEGLAMQPFPGRTSFVGVSVSS